MNRHPLNPADLARPGVTRYALRNSEKCPMAAAAERMKSLRQRRRASHLREVRLVVPDARSPEVRKKAAMALAALDPRDEAEAIAFIEAVSHYGVEGLVEDE